MRNLYLAGLCLLFIISCSKDDPPSDSLLPDANGSTLKACFTLDKNSVAVGEFIQITSCSVDATSFFYDFGNGETSVKENPKIFLEESGDYTIVLQVSDNEQHTDTFSQNIVVTGAVEDNYIFPEIPNGVLGIPLETGINPTTNKLYYIERSADLNNPITNDRFLYNELDASYNAITNYIADKPFNSQSGFVNFLPTGNLNFHFSRTLSDFYGSQEVTLTNTFGFINGINSATKHNYGYLKDGANFLYFGTIKEDGIYKTAIEKRNANGDAFEAYINPIGIGSSLIGDLIRTQEGYVAYGISFNTNTAAPQLTGYKPALIFFDTSFNITSEQIYEDSELTSIPSDLNMLNGAYHLVQLTNGNIVLYGNAEMMVTDSDGTKITSHFFNDTESIQGLIALEDSFVISTGGYLRKFDANGNQTKELKYKGDFVPEILEMGDQLFFVAGFRTTDITEKGELSVVKIFYGATDKNLNLINLN